MSRAELGAAWAEDYRDRYDERTIEMARLYVEQGMSYAQIAEEFGVTRQRVGQLLKPMDLASHQLEQRRALRARTLEAAHARILIGETSVALEAKALGYASSETLRQAFHSLGLRLLSDEPPPHGTLQRYQSRRFHCRCDLCRKANNEYNRSLRKTGREPPSHGISGYRNYGCRCDVCRAAARADDRNQRARRRMRKEVVE